MGGHGGLNILPQKRWNAYNFDNPEKVHKGEEAAAGEEQIKPAQSRRCDFELRLQKLRHTNSNPNPSSFIDLKSNHINLFADGDGDISKSKKRKRDEKEKEKEKVVMTVEDMKYKLEYGLAGKGVKAPWYLRRSEVFEEKEDKKKLNFSMEKKSVEKRKKIIEELREERTRREKEEKERERNLVRDLRRKESGHSSRHLWKRANYAVMDDEQQVAIKKLDAWLAEEQKIVLTQGATVSNSRYDNVQLLWSKRNSRCLAWPSS